MKRRTRHTVVPPGTIEVGSAQPFGSLPTDAIYGAFMSSGPRRRPRRRRTLQKGFRRAATGGPTTVRGSLRRAAGRATSSSTRIDGTIKRSG